MNKAKGQASDLTEASNNAVASYTIQVQEFIRDPKRGACDKQEGREPREPPAALAASPAALRVVQLQGKQPPKNEEH